MNIIGHGIDLIEISRVSKLIESHGIRFTEKCFSKNERSYAEGARGITRASRYAARFAAKEAVSKCLGTGVISGMRLNECEVIRDQGAPQIRLRGRFLEIAENKGVSGWIISLTHTKKHAAASVIAFSN